MEYVDYGQTGLRVSRFGLGGMRFPADAGEAIQMIRFAIDNGVNYIDTAYVYGDSEEIIGRALKDGYRERVVLATKSPLWTVRSHADFEKGLDEQLRRLGVDYIDIYMHHNLFQKHWQRVKDLDGLGFLDDMVKKGKCRFRGFSIHGTLEAFREVLDAYDWDMAQIQLNIIDACQQAGVAGLQYAAAKGVPVAIMESLRGGDLINFAPPGVDELIRAFPTRRSLAEWCFRWLYNMPAATVILSGTSTLAQLQDNIRIFANSAPNVMNAAELDLIEKIRTLFEAAAGVGCTACNYCMPCPQGVAIPEIIRMYKNLLRNPNYRIDKMYYHRSVIPKGNGADQCMDCGVCAEKCPQSLPIAEVLRQAHEALGTYMRLMYEPEEG
ncbi:MAG: aldo/keto reductase [Gracilibacteraceae bacterium]|jgi:predicted aldo/keto reductase-like oxidoreductase|nr:aldo/keto reductase [Gracilibacteraceae bacterium]